MVGGELLRAWLLRACLRAAMPMGRVGSSGCVGAVARVRRFRPEKFFYNSHLSKYGNGLR